MTHASDGGEATGTLPVVEPPDSGGASGEGGDDGEDDETRDQGNARATVAGLLLAAGTGSRFGDANKLLATLDGEPIVRRAARTLVNAGLDPLVVVVGHEAGRVRAALDDLPLTVVENPAYREGQSTSVRAGIDALPAAVDAVVIGLGDVPRVAPASVRALVDVYESGEWTALAAACEGARGNPVLFDRRHFDSLGDVSGDRGGRAVLLSGDASALVETHDPGVLRDVDTPADLNDLD
jgi:molybdenum cofactor cytidylyltransferase